MGMLSELKRRQVFKVSAAYAVVGWLLVQVASVLFDTFEAAAWVMQAFVTLVILGFPIALVLAWAFEISPEGVRRTRAAANGEPLASKSSIAGYFVTAALAGAVGAGSFWFLSRDSDSVWFQEVATPAIDSHIAVGDWAPAFAIAEEAQMRLGPNSALDEIWTRLSWVTTIDSEPRGATVYLRAYDDEETEWREVGQTPLVDTRIPLGLSRLRLELDGYLPLYRTLGGGLPARQLGPAVSAVTGLQVGTEIYQLDTATTLPAGKVRVSGWTEIVDGETVTFSDYFLDRFEVTNAQFKAFVDAGGYERADL